MSTKLKAHIENLLGNSDIVVNGTRPWDLKVHDERLYGRVLTHGTLGLGEAYMDGWWDAEQVDVFIHKLLLADFKAHFPVDIGLYGSALKGVLLNLQRSHVTEVGERHYDIGNDLYEAMLDNRMIYSCGYWKEAETLDAAQQAKLDLICRKAKLEKGMRILDIGSGWGGFLKFAAQNYGVSGAGITISKEQAAYANAHSDGLPIETRLMDYQALDDKFDRVISIGMFEHVGYKNYRIYMEKVRSLLKADGLFVLHTIGGNYSSTHGDPWSEKYIFPNGMLPSAKQITTASEGLFVMEDWHNFGADYDRTLMAWHQKFEAAWPAMKHKYDERFHRMWRYYLLSFAATFRARKVQLWQIVYSPEGVPGGYRSPR
jgi:cyclopropane-fatty-acyl-phospholipid synthase